MKKVVIIGTGISGLTAAYELKKHIDRDNLPVEIKLLERDNRIGGIFHTEKVDGFTIEAGPDSFEMFKPSPMELAEELGIDDKVIGANDAVRRTFVYVNGELQEIPPGVLGLVPKNISSLIFCPLLGWKSRFRAGLEFFIPPLKDYGGEMSLGDFYKRRFGREVFEVVAEPLFGSIYACIPENISIKACWPRGPAMEHEYGGLIRAMLARKKEAEEAEKKPDKPQQTASLFRTFKDGMVEMTDALAERVGSEAIVTGKEVVSVKPDTDGAKYSILTKDGERISADVCILATAPSYATADIVRDFDPGIADMLLRIPYVSSATVSLGYEKEGFPHPLDGFGFLVARREKMRIKAASWTSTKFNHRAPEDKVLIRCFVGNAQEETIVYHSDEEILQAVKEDLNTIMGIDVEPIVTRIYRWPNSMAQYTLGHKERVAFIENRMERYPGLYLASNAYSGLGIGDCVNIGRKTAAKTLEYLKGD